MNIVRLEVEEGFLDGLDLSFQPGLNVLIGSRGTGKSSIIELIGWVLGLPSFSKQFEARRRDHVSAILGSGRVSATLQVKDASFTVQRAATDEVPRVSRQFGFEEPLVLSQNEIELLGLQASGRLRLIDGFRSDATTANEISILAELGSLTSQIASVTAELVEVEVEASDLRSVRSALDVARAEQATFDESLADLVQEQSRLAELSQELAEGAGIGETLKSWLEAIRSWEEQIDLAIQMAPVSPQAPAVAERTAQVAGQLSEARSRLEHARMLATSARGAIESLVDETARRSISAEDESRQLRRILEGASEGAGAAARRVAELEARIVRMERMRERLTELNEHRQGLMRARDSHLELLEETRSKRIQARADVVSGLNEEFGPTIRFRLDALGNVSEYVARITESLRGSGVHYNSLAPQLAGVLSPAELLQLAERFDVDGLSAATGLAADRSARVIAALNEGGLEGIATTGIDDLVDMSLLDETEYKSSSDMSTGQRCTAVLPVLLRHDDRLVVIDQPEDNLDNAYIVDTVVKAMSTRRLGSQLICATHNANIPVLAEAAQIIQMGSDGRRGFVARQGRLSEPQIIGAIVDLMEGGREAFERRSRFYGGEDG